MQVFRRVTLAWAMLSLAAIAGCRAGGIMHTLLWVRQLQDWHGRARRCDFGCGNDVGAAGRALDCLAQRLLEDLQSPGARSATDQDGHQGILGSTASRVGWNRQARPAAGLGFTVTVPVASVKGMASYP